jgi:hypothetical protein
MVLIGRSISATMSHSMLVPLRLNVAVSLPGAFSWPPAHTN